MIPLILIIIGVSLIIVNIKAINRKENSFHNVLKYKGENITEVEVQIGHIRKDVAESITELQNEILELKEIVMESKKQNIEDIESYRDKEEEIINEINYKKEISSVNNQNDKLNKIKSLINEGYTEDEICNKLGIGKGEVLLVKGLLRQ